MDFDKFLPVLAVVLDRLVGDPRTSLHPVVLIGNLIAGLEKLLRRPAQSPLMQNAAGGLLALVVLTVVYGAAQLGMDGLLRISPWAAWGGGALLLSFTISPRSLAEAGQEIQRYLEAGDMQQARFKVGWIVGRDTEALDVGEVTRATVETVAENIVDGIISPLFYFAIGGVPLAFLYRAVNTMDSMLGYKNEKYRHFGMIPARVDDVFNYVPARITGLLLIAAAWALRLDAKQAVRMVLRDAGKHPSPNSGIPEASVAGALRIRLGGLNYYGGIPSHRATMGDPLIPLAAEHIAAAVRLMYAATFLFLAIIVVISA